VRAQLLERDHWPRIACARRFCDKIEHARKANEIEALADLTRRLGPKMATADK